MSLATILGTVASGGIREILGGVGDLAEAVRRAITGELPPEQRAELERLALEAETLTQRAQIELNRIEAASPSVFVAGWRPFVGWVCGVAVLYHYMLRDLVAWVMAATGAVATPPPRLDLTDLMTLLVAMLGFAGMRTWEKGKGVEKNGGA